MQGGMTQQHYVVVALLVVAMMLWVGDVWAFALGIPLDGFLGTLSSSVTGLGLLIGLIGLSGWIYSQMDGVHSSLLAGSVNYFTKAGILGGASTLLGALGLSSGAILW